MRIAHVSDLHFVNNRAKLMEVAKRSPWVLAGVPWLIYRRAKGRDPDDLETLLLGGATLSGLATLRPLFNHWRDYARAREALLEDLVRQRVDHVVVTGDLSTLADPLELKSAGEWIARLERRLGPETVTVMPGNHDARTPVFSRMFAPPEPVHEKLDRYLAVFARFHGSPVPFPTVRVLDGVCLVVLDSVKRAAGFNSWGWVGRRQLEDASYALRRPDARSAFKILCLHHPTYDDTVPWSLDGAPVTGRLHDARRVQEWCRREGIDLVLCGHRHDAVHRPGRPPEYVAGSTPALIHEGGALSYRVIAVNDRSYQTEDHHVAMPEPASTGKPTTV